jgi:tRNA(Ile)-lysidine synthase
VVFFQLLEEQAELQSLLTAHHLDDQIETFDQPNRGTGLSGLSGIPGYTSNDRSLYYLFRRDSCMLLKQS